MTMSALYAGCNSPEEKHIKQALCKNKYPLNTISRGQMTRDHQPEETEPPEGVPTQSHGSGSIYTYVTSPSPFGECCMAPLQIRTCFKPLRTLRDILVHANDLVPTELRKGVVYRIPCMDRGMTYVDQTGQTLNHRRKEHFRALTSADSTTSALAEHAMTTSHTIGWMEAYVLEVAPPCTPALYHRSLAHSPPALSHEQGGGTITSSIQCTHQDAFSPPC